MRCSTRGAVYYNNRQSVLSADLHNVDFRASFDSALQKYSGKLSYSDGHLQSGSFKPIPHNLEAEFDATPTTFHLSQAKLTSETSQVVLTATVQDYSHPQVQANYAATLDGEPIPQNSREPVGAGGVDSRERFGCVPGGSESLFPGHGRGPRRSQQPAA